MDFTDHDRLAVNKLVFANRILYDNGIVDGLGHVSVRCEIDKNLFLLSCNRAPALVTASDINIYGLDGEPVKQTAQRHYLERFIHSEIYKARPDVMAVVHSHSPSVIPLGVTRTKLRPVFHMAGFLNQGAAHFEIRDVAEESDLLISNSYLGQALAKSLANCSCVLMRGHGSTVVGPSLELAVYRAIYAEQNAKLQTQAIALGEVNYLTDAEALLANESNSGQIARSWNLWCERLGRIDTALLPNA